MSKFIVTGFAGFIGYHLSKRLLEEGHEVVGIDNFNSYYPVYIKAYRRDMLRQWEVRGKLVVHSCNVRYYSETNRVMCACDGIYHLAAIPGVRKSFKNPGFYVENNITGSINILRVAGEYGIPKVIMASSSSVYGNDALWDDGLGNKSVLMTLEESTTDKPLSPYAMTKKAMELAGYVYQQQYKYDVIIPRFFTVYGPAGRPDMAYYIFIQRALAGEPIDVYGDGNQVRDFTYIDDIVDGLMGLPELTGYDVINLGSGSPLSLNTMIEYICDITGLVIQRTELETQPGDVRATFADIIKAEKLLGWKPKWSLKDGIAKTVEWFNDTDLDIYKEIK